jgi:glycosyltransferase involved in cell wall biosynthesis
MPTISVLIPAYNAQRTILETINSVRQQTFKDIEIIVIDDGSGDRTVELLESIQDERLKVYSYPNTGVATARNRGIEHASGEYISFIDADDLWTEEKLEKQLEALQKNLEAGVAYSWMICMVETDNRAENTTFFSGKKVTFTGNIYSQLLLEDFIGSGSNILARRQAIQSVGKFDSSLESCEDWDYCLRLAARWDFALVPQHQIIYRQIAGLENISSKTSRMERVGIATIEKAYKAAPSELQYLKKTTLSNFYCYCSELHFKSTVKIKNFKKARECLWLAIRLKPSIILQQKTSLLISRVLLKPLIPKNLEDLLLMLLVPPSSLDKPRE